MQNTLVQMKALRNELSPIFSLPPELLSNILVTCIRAVPSDPDEWYYPATWKEHVGLTLVCKTWRAIALSTPAFWTSAPFAASAPHMYGEILARSGKRKRAFWMDTKREEEEANEFDFDYDDHRPVLAEFLDPNRLEELHLRLKRRQLYSILGNVSKGVYHSLLSLRLKYHSRSVGSLSRMFPMWLIASAPALRHLSLHNVNPWVHIDPFGSLPQNLLTLSLFNSIPQPHVLARMLSASPNLQDLELDNALGHGFPEVEHKLPFPNLANLRLHGDIYLCSRFLSQIEYPTTTTGLIQLTGDADSEELMGSLLDAMGISVDVEASKTYSSMRLTRSYFTRISLGQGQGQTLDVRVESSENWIAAMLRVQGVQQLALEKYEHCRSTLRQLLVRHPDVATLQLDSLEDPTNTLELLGGPPQPFTAAESSLFTDDESDDVELRMLLPHLKEIRIQDIRFSDEFKISVFMRGRRLTQMLIDRCNHGYPVEKLHFTGKKLIRHSLRQTLEEIVGVGNVLVTDDSEPVEECVSAHDGYDSEAAAAESRRKLGVYFGL